jgi:hypothetical protein
MAQADPITTATGEGVSRGGSTKSTSLRSAHTEPTAALGGNPTHLIESEDLLVSRVDCLDKAFAALHRYVTAFVSDTAQQIAGCSLNRKHLNKLFVDLRSEAVAVIRNAPEGLRNHENWKVS